MSQDRRRDLLFVFLGAILVGGGILLWILLFGGEDSNAVGPTETTSVSAPPPTEPGETSTTSSSTSTSSSSPSSTGASGSSSPSDQSGPAILTVKSTEGSLWEIGTYPACSSNPQTARAIVEVSDPAGIDSVQLTWTLNSNSQTVVMTRGPDGAYFAPIGPFSSSTLPGGGAAPIDVEVYARDGVGNETTALVGALTWVNDCSDQDPPDIFVLQTTESDLWENANYGGCPSNPQSAQISAIVQDPSGVAGVELEWSINALSWSAAMPEIAPEVYSVTIGPFHEDTLAIGGGTATFRIRMFADDTHGNQRIEVSDTLVTLHDCAI